MDISIIEISSFAIIVLAFAFQVFIFFYNKVSENLRDEASRKQYIKELRQQEPKKRAKAEEYKEKLNNFLDKLDFWLGTPFSSQARNINIFLSIFYSFSFFYISWIFGANGNIASVKVLSETIPILHRVIILLIICTIVFFLFYIKGYKKALVLVLVLALAGAGTAVAIVLVILMVLLSGAGEKKTLAVVSEFGIVIVLAVLSISVVAAAISISVSVAVAVAVMVIAVVIKLKTNNKKHLVLYLLNIFFLAGLFVFFIWKKDSLEFSQRLKEFIIVIFFIVLLPNINGLLDWLSFALSRKLGRKIIKMTSYLSILVLLVLDCVLAFIFLFLLIFLLSFSIELFDLHILQASAIKIDVSQYISSMRENSIFAPDNLWITFMLFSTLIPTAFHFLKAFMFIPHTGCIPQLVKNKIANSIEKIQSVKDQRYPAFLLIALGRTSWLFLGVVLISTFFYVIFRFVPYVPNCLYFVAEYAVQFANYIN